MGKLGVQGLQISAFSSVLSEQKGFHGAAERTPSVNPIQVNKASCQGPSLSPAWLHKHLPTFSKIRNSIDWVYLPCLWVIYDPEDVWQLSGCLEVPGQKHNKETEEEEELLLACREASKNLITVFKWTSALSAASFMKIIGEMMLQIWLFSLQMFIFLGLKHHDSCLVLFSDSGFTSSPSFRWRYLSFLMYCYLFQPIFIGHLLDASTIIWNRPRWMRENLQSFLPRAGTIVGG